MKNKKGNIAVIAIIVVIVAITAGVVGWLVAKTSQAPTQQPAEKQQTTKTKTVVQTQPEVQQTTPKQSVSSTTDNAGEKNVLSACGITVTVKNKLPVKTESINSAGIIWHQMTIGGDMPDSRLEISCTAKNKNPKTNLDKLRNDASSVLDVQSDGATKVNKTLYNVFDATTISNISNLYSAMNRGYRAGSETVGFSNQDWVYTFSFMNPKENKNQDTFAISVKQ